MLIKPKIRTAADGLRLRDAARMKQHTADFLETAGDPVGARWERREADEADRRANDILKLRDKPATGTGGELCLSVDDAAKKPGLACTVESPDAVTAEASLDRLELTAEAKCLAMAADAAETIQSRNSLEKMLAHQMAAAHAASMRMVARAEQEFERSEHQGTEARHQAQLSATRLMNSAARLMTSFQDGAATLHRLRTGGRQVVTVQRVNVADGGQAVVAGNIDRTTGGPKGGGGREK